MSGSIFISDCHFLNDDHNTSKPHFIFCCLEERKKKKGVSILWYSFMLFCLPVGEDDISPLQNKNFLFPLSDGERRLDVSIGFFLLSVLGKGGVYTETNRRKLKRGLCFRSLCFLLYTCLSPFAFWNESKSTYCWKKDKRRVGGGLITSLKSMPYSEKNKILIFFF